MHQVGPKADPTAVQRVATGQVYALYHSQCCITDSAHKYHNTATDTGTDAALSWVNEYCLSAAVLGFAVVLARAANPDAFHLLRCIAATFPLAAGYNRTARASARGGCLCT